MGHFALLGGYGRALSRRHLPTGAYLIGLGDALPQDSVGLYNRNTSSMAKQASIVGNTVRSLDGGDVPPGATETSMHRTPRCPKCGGDKVDVAYGPYGVYERLAVVAMRFPVECGLCGCRFGLSVLKGDLDLVLRRRHIVFILVVVLLLLWGTFLAGYAIATARGF